MGLVSSPASHKPDLNEHFYQSYQGPIPEELAENNDPSLLGQRDLFFVDIVVCLPNVKLVVDTQLLDLSKSIKILKENLAPSYIIYE